MQIYYTQTRLPVRYGAHAQFELMRRVAHKRLRYLCLAGPYQVLRMRACRTIKPTPPRTSLSICHAPVISLIIMAETPDTIEKTLEELEREISCAVCHGHYQQA